MPHDEYLTLCGKIQSTIGVVTLIDQLDLKAQEIDEHRRATASSPTDTDRSALAFFGSGWWDAKRKSAPVFKP